VAELIRERKSSKEIAALLRLSPRAVSCHRSNIRSLFPTRHPAESPFPHPVSIRSAFVEILVAD
jgi:hypothetical protein